MDAELVNALRLVIQEQLQPLNERFDTIDSHLEKIDNRLDKMDSRLENLELRMDKVESRLENVELRLDKVDLRLDSFEDRFDSVQNSLNRIEAAQNEDIIALIKHTDKKLTDFQHETSVNFKTLARRMTAMETDLSETMVEVDSLKPAQS
ncbi:hypothetical protein [Cohnella fermenti]|uniref:t-SNARE coiled-coil homology domain-containing protein n=1 Tax=Cohnella fermenti TaxID=2565925 RepID=A0A4V3WEV0_9BACL|nr:hypothetical protein [Cohnella fermenti]THF77768.1 hypothetical protein E6C55_15630 [Cohnella fermenti]